jgi:hypothetical protein
MASVLRGRVLGGDRKEDGSSSSPLGEKGQQRREGDGEKKQARAGRPKVTPADLFEKVAGGESGIARLRKRALAEVLGKMVAADEEKNQPAAGGDSEALPAAKRAKKADGEQPQRPQNTSKARDTVARWKRAARNANLVGSCYRQWAVEVAPRVIGKYAGQVRFFWVWF